MSGGLSSRGRRGADGSAVGVIGAYVVVIAVLWNIPYVKHVLYPFSELLVAFFLVAALLTSSQRCSPVRSICALAFCDADGVVLLQSRSTSLG